MRATHFGTLVAKYLDDSLSMEVGPKKIGIPSLKTYSKQVLPEEERK